MVYHQFPNFSDTHIGTTICRKNEREALGQVRPGKVLFGVKNWTWWMEWSGASVYHSRGGDGETESVYHSRASSYKRSQTIHSPVIPSRFRFWYINWPLANSCAFMKRQISSGFWTMNCLLSSQFKFIHFWLVLEHVFPYIGNHHPNWLIVFKMFKTTNLIWFLWIRFFESARVWTKLCENIISSLR